MNSFKRVVKMFKLTFKLSKTYYLLIILQAIIRTAKVVVGVYGLRLIIEGLVSGETEKAFIYCGIVLSSEVIILLLQNTFNSAIEISRRSLMQTFYRYTSGKMMKLEFNYLESPKYLDLASKAKYAVDNFNGLNGYITSLAEALYQLFVFVSMITILVMFDPLIILIIAGFVIIHLIINVFSNRKQKALFEELGPVNRKMGYFSDAVTNLQFTKDFRMYPLESLVYSKYNKFLKETSDYLIYFHKVLFFYINLHVIFNYSQVLIIYLYIGYQSITLAVGVGVYIFVTASAIKVSESLNGFAGSLGNVVANSNYLKPFLELMELEDAETLSLGNDSIETLKSLRFENVSFTYPGSENLVLDNVSFEINKGEKISIVGINGAGKTTVVKLICRLYNPDSGTIYWNDKDIREYNYYSYTEAISAVFQDFKLFALTLAENIDIENTNHEKIDKCVNQVGLQEKIASYPDGINTYFSKEYYKEGVELSGGEKQKVAIARAMYKPSSLTILDEPTSALDPLSEAEIYKNFSTLVQDKTSIYISHRMSSSVFCDRIIVIDEGTVKSNDTHDNLMKEKDSMYYKLFNSQSEYYQTD